ncbi:MAG: hypothetical protein JOZ05_21690, partial [Acetobacteraceae bacterium]|nr:hypothetical protein [Acetobacteraceae bacterium]
MGWGRPDGTRPLFVVTHHPPERVPASDPPYTFVIDGIEAAVTAARQAAGIQDVVLMGASIVQQCLRAGLLDELLRRVAMYAAEEAAGQGRGGAADRGGG